LISVSSCSLRSERFLICASSLSLARFALSSSARSASDSLERRDLADETRANSTSADAIFERICGRGRGAGRQEVRRGAARGQRDAVRGYSAA